MRKIENFIAKNANYFNFWQLNNNYPCALKNDKNFIYKLAFNENLPKFHFQFPPNYFFLKL